MENNFIIFLDIDGVICSYSKNIHVSKGINEYSEIDGKHNFLPSAVEALNKLIVNYNAHLCMISSWNSDFGDEKQYTDFLICRGINVINGLSFGDKDDRSNYITTYISDNDIKDYLIIDDEAHQYYKMCFKTDRIEYKRIIKPNMDRCLDMYDVDSCIKWVK